MAADRIRFSVAVAGVPEARRAIRSLGVTSTDPRVRTASAAASQRMAALVRADAAADADPRSARVAATVRPARGATPGFGIGGARRVVSGGRRRRSDGGAAGVVMFGALYGTRYRGWPGAFRPHRGQRAYWLWPTMERNRAVIVRPYLAALDAIIDAEWQG